MKTNNGFVVTVSVLDEDCDNDEDAPNHQKVGFMSRGGKCWLIRNPFVGGVASDLRMKEAELSSVDSRIDPRS